MKKELEIGIVIESEVDDDSGLDDIGELIAMDLYEMLYNGEDYLEVYYRGYDDFEDTGLFS